MTLQPHDVSFAVSQLRNLMIEFWLGAAMMAIGFTGITAWSYSLLRSLRKTVPVSRQWENRNDR